MGDNRVQQFYEKHGLTEEYNESLRRKIAEATEEDPNNYKDIRRMLGLEEGGKSCVQSP